MSCAKKKPTTQGMSERDACLNIISSLRDMVEEHLKPLGSAIGRAQNDCTAIDRSFTPESWKNCWYSAALLQKFLHYADKALTDPDGPPLPDPFDPDGDFGGHQFECTSRKGDMEP